MFNNLIKSKHNVEELYDDISMIKSALRKAAYDVKANAGEMINQSIESAEENAEDIKDNMSKYIAKKPLQSVSLSVITGLVVGYLLTKY